ncbi:hypothetical protein V8D89_008858 [Ganoderma adspersum]
MTFPECLPATTFGILDEYAGELPRTYVVLKPKVADVIQKDPRLVVRMKASYKGAVQTAFGRGAGVEFINVISKNGAGEILRHVLRDLSLRQSSAQERARL